MQKCEVVVYELATGHEKSCRDLPQEQWLDFRRWTGAGIEAKIRVSGNDHGDSAEVAVRFDPSAPAETFEAIPGTFGHRRGEERSYCLVSDGSILRATLIPPETPGAALSVLQQCQDWMLKLMGRLSDRNLLAVRVGMTRRDNGKSTYELPVLVPHPVQLSPTGSLLVSGRPGGGVMVWDLNPAPRWPWIAGLGILVGSLPWLPLLGRRGQMKKS